jgi:Zinc knuckle
MQTMITLAPRLVYQTTNVLATNFRMFNAVLVHLALRCCNRFGPLSGTSAEERLVVAYLGGQLNPRAGKESAADVKMCIECGEAGHFRRDCPAIDL